MRPSPPRLPSLVEFWRELSLDAAPYVHPKDRRDLLGAAQDRVLAEAHLGFDEYIRSNGFGTKDGKLHCSLLPMPFVGDLAAADIFVLLLNPGLSFQNYFAEYRIKEYRDRLIANLRGDNARYEYPFLCLDPEFCWDGGFVWWEKKLHGIVHAIAARDRATYRDALRTLARRLAAVELVPYHSATSPGGSLQELPSAMAARQFVHGTLVPRARAGTALIVVTRQVSTWGIPAGLPNVVLYDPSRARAAHMSVDSPGGSAVWGWLQRVPAPTPQGG